MPRLLSSTLRLAAVLCLLLALAPSAPAVTAQGPTPFVVTTTADTVDATPGDGVCADASNECSLRAAVMEANALPSADTIHVPAGTYTLSIPNANPQNGENLALTGDLDVIGDLAIIGGGGNPNADPALTVIQAANDTDGHGIDKVFSFNPTFLVPGDNFLAALTIQNGYNRSGLSVGGERAGDGWGGGLDWDASNGGTLTIDNCRILNNTATLADGGGIALWNTNPIPHEIPTAGSVIITRSVISGNSAPTARGGGIFTGPYLTVSIDSSTINNNRAAGALAAGGGVFFGGTAEVSNSTFSANTSTGVGGGLASGSPSGEVVTLRNVTVTANRADSDNSGGEPGGGVAVLTAPLRAYNSLIVGNFTGTGGTIANVTGALNPASTGNLTSGAAVALGPLANNGGPTLTHKLLTGSPALDAGINTQAPTDLDQRGQPRLADSADAGTMQTVDIGAYEAHPTVQDVPNQTMPAGTQRPLPFRVGDVSPGLPAITSVTAVFSNPALFPPAQQTLTPTVGDGYSLLLSPAPGLTGAATVTLTVTAPNGQTAVDTFTVLVYATRIYLPTIRR